MGKRSKKKLEGHLGGNKLKEADLDKTLKELAVLSSTSYIQENNTAATYHKLNIVLAKIIRLESEKEACAFAWCDGPRSKHFPELIDWLKCHGGDVQAVSIAESPSCEYGLQAEVDAEDGSLVCAVPRKVMIIVEEKQSPELWELSRSDPMLKHMGNVALVICLLSELSKGSSSFWAPYIASLPRTYNTVLYFTHDEMAALKGSPAQEAAMLQNIHIARQYAYFHELCLKSENKALQLLKGIFTYNLYRWAVSTVLTRQNLIPASDDQSRKVPALIPVWDMCNHTPGPITTDYNRELDRCECFALNPLVKGQQVLISYGNRSNTEFFLHNAFVPDENPNDQYKIHLGLTRTDVLRALRAELLAKLELPCGGDFYVKSGSGPVDDDLLAFIRVFCMDKASLEHWIESHKWNDLKCLDCALDTKIETKAWSFLATRISLLLAVYSQPPQNGKTSAALKLINNLIESEKKLLQSAQDYAKLKAEH